MYLRKIPLKRITFRLNPAATIAAGCFFFLTRGRVYSKIELNVEVCQKKIRGEGIVYYAHKMNKKTVIEVKNISRLLLIVACDIFVILLSFLAAVVLRDNSFITRGVSVFKDNFREITITCVCVCVSLAAVHNYTTSWRYAGGWDYFMMYTGMAGGFAFSSWLSRFLVLNEEIFEISDYALCFIVSMCGFTVTRFTANMIMQILRRYFGSEARKTKHKTRVMIIGAGDTGSALIKTLKKDGSRIPVVAIDDDEKKCGMRVVDVPVVGGRSKIISAVKEYRIQEIVIAIPTSNDADRTEILNICSKTNAKTMTVPSLFELASGKASVQGIREVTPQELLGRAENIIDGKDIFGYIEGKTVMVTGGGGSIGSELCRQIAKYNPKQLIVFDIYENNAYELQLELRKKFPEMRLEVLIGSVRDSLRLDEIFSKYKPRVVFHAAAHKHVPLMEDSPNEAIKNNVYGTYNVSKACAKYDVERFVLISTDKAVNPTNVMGASKRIAEMVMQRWALYAKENGKRTIFTAVRFGNVLGSNGSVIPLFKKQIKEGGPVTVTHPEINRFFMTIPEAAQLVMQAGAYAEGGEIFILDMGEPVKIVDLAKNLIELSGYTPDVDIKIEFSGLRPGEKMYEELLLDRQRHSATKHNRIFIEQPVNDGKELIGEIHSLKERLLCDITIYEDMVDWFKEQFDIKV